MLFLSFYQIKTEDACLKCINGCSDFEYNIQRMGSMGKKQLNKEFKKATNNEKMLFKHLKN